MGAGPYPQDFRKYVHGSTATRRSDPKVHATRVIFERGYEISRNETSEWKLKTYKLCRRFKSVSAFKDEFRVRPVLLSINDDHGDRQLLLSPSEAGIDFRIRQIKFAVLAHNQKPPTIFHTINLHYVVGAVVYHCKQLANLYAQITGNHRDQTNEPDLGSYWCTDRPEPYFEFEALVTAARRAYDSARYILWNGLLNEVRPTPRSFPATLKQCKFLPDKLRDRLEHSWRNYGERLTDYRDCIQHYVPISAGTPHIRLEKTKEQVWSCCALIPDNPEARSLHKFTYNMDRDALTYGWELCDEVVQVAHAILTSLPESGLLLEEHR